MVCRRPRHRRRTRGVGDNGGARTDGLGSAVSGRRLHSRGGRLHFAGAGVPSRLPNCSRRDRAWGFAASPALPHLVAHVVVSGPCADVGTDRHPFRCCATRNLPELHLFRGEALSVRNSARLNPKKGRHASASNFPEPCNSGGLQHHPSEYRVFARVSRNVGTTTGLHARRLAAMRRANPRCEQDRGLLTAKYSATQRSVPRGF
jgi:hypothetical protein